jgi:hypothetical protein
MISVSIIWSPRQGEETGRTYLDVPKAEKAVPRPGSLFTVLGDGLSKLEIMAQVREYFSQRHAENENIKDIIVLWRGKSVAERIRYRNIACSITNVIDSTILLETL